MTGSHISLTSFVLPAAFVVAVFIGGDSARSAAPAAISARAAALFESHCFDCHSDDLAEARINLQQMTEQPEFGRGFRNWDKVVRVLREGIMPPPDRPQPQASERREVAAAIENSLAAYVEQHAGDPGAVPLRRLTNAEYAYTIHDLTGLRLDVSRGLAGDAVGGEGFTNVGSAQFMQDSTLERYLEAAREVADHAVIGAGPLSFYEDSGETGRELAAITRIKNLYRMHGFRTAAGEGAEPFGLDLYPRALFVAWRYSHRDALGEPASSLPQLAQREGLNERFTEHIWNTLHTRSPAFPLSFVIERWRSLPQPEDASLADVRAACDALGRELRAWQSTLAASAGDEEEASVLTAGKVQVTSEHSFRADVNWPDEATEAEFELSVTTASNVNAKGAYVIWRNARLRFRHDDNRRSGYEPLISHLSEATRNRLVFGRHPAGVRIGERDFVIGGEQTVSIELVVPQGTVSAQLFVDVELDVKQGADRIVRCRIADGAVEGETAAEVGDSSTLLANPQSPAVKAWTKGVVQFASLLPEVSHREPAPSDRDPIPAPFDNTYNNAERNHFHVFIKYHRDDEFLVKHLIDDSTGRALDEAWTDLLTSSDYHNCNLRFVSQKFGLGLDDKSIVALDSAEIGRLPDEARGYVQKLCDERDAMQYALQAAEPTHVGNALRLAERAWRRPLAQTEQQRLRAFYAALREKGLGHSQAIRALLTRIFLAPAFLYRIEPTAGEGAAIGDIVPHSNWELANRLSYFLWSSVPDEPLRQAAAAGKLHEPEVLAAQVRRMLRDPKARRFAAEFFGQWLGFYRFDDFQGIDTDRFREFQPELRAAMYDEAVSFFEYLIREDRPISETLFADYTFANARLARHYGLDADHMPAGQTVRVTNVSPHHRGGLLGMAAIHAVTSAPLRTSAVKRGDWVLRRLVGTPVPPPPADAGSIAADDTQTDGATIRQLLEKHRDNAACYNCHSRFDALGFALENYDPIGRWREAYRDGQPVESYGKLHDGTELKGFSGLRQYLRQKQPEFHRTLVVKLLGYALGRVELASDRVLVDKILAQLEQDERFSEVVVAIANSRQFRFRRVE